MDDFIRVTIRYPRKYENALKMMKEDSCISKNAVIVKAIREFAERVAGQHAVGSQSPATTNNNTALQGGASITQDKRTI